MPTPLLVTVKDAAVMLSLSTSKVYELAADGHLEKKYVGTGSRNFRLTVKSIERYVAGLSQDPVSA